VRGKLMQNGNLLAKTLLIVCCLATVGVVNAYAQEYRREPFKPRMSFGSTNLSRLTTNSTLTTRNFDDLTRTIVVNSPPPPPPPPMRTIAVHVTTCHLVYWTETIGSGWWDGNGTYHPAQRITRSQRVCD